MKKLLWIGDAGCESGFARSTHGVLETLHKHYETYVLGLNYRGDQGGNTNPYPYTIYVAAAGGDLFGMGRLIEICDLVKPDVIVIQNDPWNFPGYLGLLHRYPEYKNIPVIGVVAVDGKNCRGDMLRGLKLAIFWTEFGKQEALQGGFTGTKETGRASATVIPLGVDRTLFFPMEKEIAREEAGLKVYLPEFDDAFIVGNVNRNQFRKRWDLTAQYFAEWVKEYDVHDAYLFLHTSPTGDTGPDIQRLMEYYGLGHKLVLREPAPFLGVSDARMRATYNSFDVCVSTTQGEGMGLPTLEAMACRIPCIAPDWSALGDWGRDAIRLISCTTTCIGPPYSPNVIGGIPDKELFIKALDAMYASRDEREYWAQKGFDRACEERFSWRIVGDSFVEALNYVLEPQEVSA